LSKERIRTNPNDKKTSKWVNWLIYGGLCVFALYFSMAFGAALDSTVDVNGKVQIALVEKHLNPCLNDPAFTFSCLKQGGYALKITLIVLFSIGLYAVYKLSMGKKRLHRKGVEHGSARWGTPKEAEVLEDAVVVKKFFGIFKSYVKTQPTEQIMRDVETKKPLYAENNDFLKAKIDNNIVFSKEAKMSLNTRYHGQNLNVLIIGGTGAGKTRFMAKPNIMQLNTSFVITDPKGEILGSTAKMLLEAGYELKVFNLDNMEQSSNYNPFAYVYDFEGQLQEENVVKMVNVFMRNTTDEKKSGSDPFWDNSAQKLILSIVFLLFEESEYNAEFKDGKIIPETRDLSHLNFYSVGEKLRKIAYPADSRDVNFKSPLDLDFEELERRKPNTLASLYYKEFRIAPAETGQSIVTTANSRTQHFNQAKVANLTCCDTIQMETIGDKKTALFIVTSATDPTFNFLAAMMYTQLFDVLAQRAFNKYSKQGKTLPVHVRFILDEFANIGEIPHFENVIAFVRSAGMSLNIIIQNFAQLKSRYEKTYETIIGNCDTKILLGGSEESTLKFFSEGMGKETIDVEGRNRTKAYRSNSSTENNSILGRELMTTTEISTMKRENCIVMVRSRNPFFCDKYPIEKHPNFQFLDDFDKKNFFDITNSNIKVITLAEFQAKNGDVSAKAKLEKEIKEVEIKPVVLPVKIEPLTAENEEYEAETVEEMLENIVEVETTINETISDGDSEEIYLPMFTSPENPYKTMDLGESEIEKNETTYNLEVSENELSELFSLVDTKEEDYSKTEPIYGEVAENAQTFEGEIPENIAETSDKTQTENSPLFFEFANTNAEDFTLDDDDFGFDEI
jgi:type IV secretion system protein VirD4